MNFHKLLSLSLAVLLFCSGLAPVAAQERAKEMTLLEKVGVVEKFFYGQEQTGALLERVNKLELEVAGVTENQALTSKVEHLYNHTKDNSLTAPSFMLKLNAVEWALTHSIGHSPAKSRLEQLEQSINGQSMNGSFNMRLDKLIALAYAKSEIGVTTVPLAKDTLVKVKLLSPIDSKIAKAGDVILLEVAEDVLINGALAVSKGAQAYGKVLKAEGAQNFGRDGELQLSVDDVKAFDGKDIETMLGEKAKEQNKSLATAAGASLAGIALLGPVGIVGGVFVHGKEVKLPAGAEFYVQTKSETEVYGIQVK